jgi:hypothetical protein
MLATESSRTRSCTRFSTLRVRMMRRSFGSRPKEIRVTLPTVTPASRTGAPTARPSVELKDAQRE